MQFAECNGVVLHHSFRRSQPERPVLVLINSITTDFRIWDWVAPALGEEFDLLRYDKRGHGLSEIGTTPYTIETHAADLAALMDRLSVPKAVICGVSVGGLVAQGLYAARPDLVSALVICSSAHKIGTPELWNGRIAQAETEGLSTMSQATIERWFTPAFQEREPGLMAGIKAMVERTPVEGFTGTLAAVRDADFTEAARKIAVPTLCVAGSADPGIKPEVVKGLADLVPGALFATVPDTAHLPMIQAPDAFLAVLRPFLESLRPA